MKEIVALTSHNHGDKRHEDGQCNCWEKTTDNTHDGVWNLGEPVEPVEALEIGNVGDKSNGCNRDGPENNQRCNETDDSKSANNSLPPRDLQGLPDNLVGAYANKFGRHYFLLVI